MQRTRSKCRTLWTKRTIRPRSKFAGSWDSPNARLLARLQSSFRSPAKVSPLRERIHQQRRMGHRFVSCYPVLCELEVGIQQTPKPEENRRRLTQLLRHVRLWPLDAETARIYGAVYLELRRQGRVLSQVDMILAGLAPAQTYGSDNRPGFCCTPRFACRELGYLSGRA